MDGAGNAALPTFATWHSDAPVGPSEPQQGSFRQRRSAEQSDPARRRSAQSRSPEPIAGVTGNTESLRSRQVTTPPPSSVGAQPGAGASPEAPAARVATDRFAVRRIETTLPIDTGRPVAVECHIVPASALRAGFTTEPGAERRARASPVPVQTILKNSRGRTLFSALRQGIMDLSEITSEYLSSLSDEELRSLVGDLLFREVSVRETRSTRARQIDKCCQAMRSGSVYMTFEAETMNAQLRRNQARETAAAVLAVDPVKLQKALDGMNVVVQLFCIWILTKADIAAARAQSQEFDKLNTRSWTFLPVLEPNGKPRMVPAIVRLRTFFLRNEKGPPSTDERDFYRQQHAQVQDLLGYHGLSGGAVEVSCAAVNHRLIRLNKIKQELDRVYRRNCRALGAEHPISREQARTLDAMTEETRSSTTTIRTLVRTRAQLQDLWTGYEAWPDEPGYCKQLASRLALIGHLMAQTPVLFCNSERFAEECDRETQFLATVADSSEGDVPPTDMDRRFWGSAHDAFAA